MRSQIGLEETIRLCAMSFLPLAILVIRGVLVVSSTHHALEALPWEVPDFSVKHYESALRSLQRRLERERELRFRKPKQRRSV